MVPYPCPYNDPNLPCQAPTCIKPTYSCPGEMSTAAQGLAAPEVRAEWERETATTLKHLGFPSSEGLNSAVTLLPRVTTCLTRRLVNLGEFLLELEKADEDAKGKQKKNPDVKAESILTKPFGCNLCETQ